MNLVITRKLGKRGVVNYRRQHGIHTIMRSASVLRSTVLKICLLCAFSDKATKWQFFIVKLAHWPAAWTGGSVPTYLLCPKQRHVHIFCFTDSGTSHTLFPAELVPGTNLLKYKNWYTPVPARKIRMLNDSTLRTHEDPLCTLFITNKPW